MLPPDRHWLCQHPDGFLRFDGDTPAAILAGSFNPLHDGHARLADVASRRLGLPVHFELSVVNVDKPELPAEEVARRLTQFRGKAHVWVTRAMTFERKAEIFPGTTFVVGADTAVRVVAPKYYEASTERRDRSLSFIRDRGCRFLVAGRLGDSAFVTLEQIAVPFPFAGMFEAIGEEEFRVDLSSTALRRAGHSGC